MGGVPRRRRSWYATPRSTAPTRKTRALAVMRTRSPDAGGSSRDLKEGRGVNGERDPSPCPEEAGRGATSCSPSCLRTATWLPGGLAPAPAAADDRSTAGSGGDRSRRVAGGDGDCVAWLFVWAAADRASANPKVYLLALPCTQCWVSKPFLNSLFQDY
jgi:hypothetical protein